MAVNIDIGKAETRIGLEMALDVVRPTDQPVTYDAWTNQLSANAYVIANGFPHGDAAYGMELYSHVGMNAAPSVVAIPTPATFVTGSDARFIPNGAYFNGQVWSSVYGGATISMYDALGVSSTAVAIEGGFNYPNIHKKRISNPAMDFDRKGYGVLATGSASSTCTLAMVLVPNHGAHAYYDIYHSNGPNPCVIRYALGRLEVYNSGSRVMDYETHTLHGGALVFILSLDGVNDIARMVIVDKKKATRNFRIAGMDVNGFSGFIGASNAAFNQLYADMDILDINFWNHAMDFPEMERHVHGIGVTYQVP